MIRSRVLIIGVLMLILVVFANAQTKSEIKLTKEDRKMASEYKFKAIEYLLSWNQSDRKFEVIEDIRYFKQFESKYHNSCCLMDVTLRDGISFFLGEPQHKFHMVLYVDINESYDFRKIAVIQLDTKQIIWRTD